MKRAHYTRDHCMNKELFNTYNNINKSLNSPLTIQLYETNITYSLNITTATTSAMLVIIIA